MLSTLMSSAAAAGIGAGAMIIPLLIGVVALVAEWRIYSMAGEPGWACLIPIYNMYVLYKIVYGKGIKFLLLIVPILGEIAAIMLIVRLGQRFGKSTGFIIGMLFLSPIFLLMLAFGNSSYQGPDTSCLI